MPDALLDPWTEAVDDFPLLGDDAAQLRALVRYAVLAPSGHNTQPWRFAVGADALELRADRTRALPVVDPADRELTISLGAALYHLRLAARRFGRVATVDLLPAPHDPDLVARLRLAPGPEPSGEERRLFAAIPRRHTNRGPFASRPVPPEVIEQMGAAAAVEGAWLHVVAGDARLALAELIAEGDRRQMADAAFRRELAAWVRPNRSDRPDGIPGYTQGIGDLASIMGPLVLRTFDLGRGQAAHDRELALGSPLLAVLGTAGDEPSDWLAAGQALARLLLVARDAGVQASFLNQAIEVEPLRAEVHRLLRWPGAPQLVLRFGFGREVRPTPRRPVADVLT